MSAPSHNDGSLCAVRSTTLCETELREGDASPRLCEIQSTSHKAGAANRAGEAPEESGASPSANQGFAKPEQCPPLCDLNSFLCESRRDNTFELTPSSEGEDSFYKGFAPSHNVPVSLCDCLDFSHNEKKVRGPRLPVACETFGFLCGGKDWEGRPRLLSSQDRRRIISSGGHARPETRPCGRPLLLGGRVPLRGLSLAQYVV